MPFWIKNTKISRIMKLPVLHICSQINEKGMSGTVELCVSRFVRIFQRPSLGRTAKLCSHLNAFQVVFKKPGFFLDIRKRRRFCVCLFVCVCVCVCVWCACQTLKQCCVCVTMSRLLYNNNNNPTPPYLQQKLVL
jgi:hypothetical protein